MSPSTDESNLAHTVPISHTWVIINQLRVSIALHNSRSGEPFSGSLNDKHRMSNAVICVLQAQKLGCTVLKPVQKSSNAASRLAVTVTADYVPITKPQGGQPLPKEHGGGSSLHHTMTSIAAIC